MVLRTLNWIVACWIVVSILVGLLVCCGCKGWAESGRLWLDRAGRTGAGWFFGFGLLCWLVWTESPVTRGLQGGFACNAVLVAACWQQVLSSADVVLVRSMRGGVRVFGVRRAASWGVLVRAACFALRLVRIFCQLKFTREEHSSRDACVCAARGFRAGVFCGGSCLVRPGSGVARGVHWGGAGRDGEASEPGLVERHRLIL